MKTNHFCLGIESLDPSVNGFSICKNIKKHLNQLSAAMESLLFLHQAGGAAIVDKNKAVKSKAYVELTKEFNKTVSSIGIERYSSIGIESFSSENKALESIMDSINNGITTVTKAINIGIKKIGDVSKSIFAAVRRTLLSNKSRVEYLRTKSELLGEERPPFKDTKLMQNLGFGIGGGTLTEVLENAFNCYNATSNAVMEAGYLFEDFLDRPEKYKYEDISKIINNFIIKKVPTLFKDKHEGDSQSVSFSAPGSVVNKRAVFSYKPKSATIMELLSNVSFSCKDIQKTSFEPVSANSSDANTLVAKINEFNNNEKQLNRIANKIEGIVYDGIFMNEMEDDYNGDGDQSPFDSASQKWGIVSMYMSGLLAELYETFWELNQEMLEVVNDSITYVEKSLSNR